MTRAEKIEAAAERMLAATDGVEWFGVAIGATSLDMERSRSILGARMALRAALAAPASPGPEPAAMEEIERLVEDFHACVGYAVEAEEEDHDYASSLEDLKTAKAALFLAIRRALGAPLLTFDKTAADALAVEVEKLIERKVIDSRSPAADALLDYRDGKIQGPHLGSASPGERREPCGYCPDCVEENGKCCGNPICACGGAMVDPGPWGIVHGWPRCEVVPDHAPFPSERPPRSGWRRRAWLAAHPAFVPHPNDWKAPAAPPESSPEAPPPDSGVWDYENGWSGPLPAPAPVAAPLRDSDGNPTPTQLNRERAERLARESAPEACPDHNEPWVEGTPCPTCGGKRVWHSGLGSTTTDEHQKCLGTCGMERTVDGIDS